MEKTKITLSETKELVINDRVVSDMQQFIDNYKNSAITKGEAGFQELKERIDADPHLKRVFDTTCMEVGKTVWIELNIIDSYHSQLLFDWLYVKSKYLQDNPDGTQIGSLALFGGIVKAIHWGLPNKNNLTSEETETLKHLISKITDGK